MMSMWQLVNGLRSLIDEARALAGAGADAQQAAANNLAFRNAGVIGPATQVTHFPAAGLTAKVSGKFLITAMISGTDAAIDDPVLYELIRDPVNHTGAPGGTFIAAGPSTQLDSSHVNKFFGFTLNWIDVVPVGSTHNWGITAISSGNNLTVAGGQGSITVVELPG